MGRGEAQLPVAHRPHSFHACGRQIVKGGHGAVGIQADASLEIGLVETGKGQFIVHVDLDLVAVGLHPQAVLGAGRQFQVGCGEDAGVLPLDVQQLHPALFRVQHGGVGLKGRIGGFGQAGAELQTRPSGFGGCHIHLYLGVVV